ncbi:hypothetical protein JN11_02637 [Mucilaginibacter frigoritolerans]|uniref:Uncharacterized protein n=1 Tax=Mucilaginibacter frigoritolerans TaxID=652788 RepID=A0A562U2J3_9SPHI|nr:hypothetical protein [Mucilaginibacter frigoritolerans]TWI99320.1 hypothetical protein JN11_02637 [Mucilaginibacter frigoritolerans]
MRKIFKSAVIVIVLITNLINIASAQQPKSLYNIVVDDGGGFASFDGKNYITIQVYLNNNSNDTLYYRGADCYNLLFSMRSNPYFHLANDVCHQSGYLKTVLPPHRSQKMTLYLIMDKAPSGDGSIPVNMNLYKWGGDEGKPGKQLLYGNLSDSILLHYNSNHQNYLTKKDFEIRVEKEKSILPDKDIYLLTDNDRKLYTLTVENAKISVPRDTIIARENNKSKKAKAVTVPLVLHNNSNDTLRFYTMTCSWYIFFDTNVRGIGISGWACDKNIPDLITIAPYKEYKRNLNIDYQPNIKSGSRYRISMSLLKDPGKWIWPREYVRFNKIWSNEIAIQ